MAFRRILTRAILCVAAGLLIGGTSPARTQTSDPSFAGRIASLSEPGGYFDTDNLISNERSYLHVLPVLARADVRGGAYVGVGPDQNFSYIAAIRPDIAVIVDIRRDNLLLHLLFKALFELADTRVTYLAMLTGRQQPADIESWRTRDIGSIVNYIDQAPADDPRLAELTRVVLSRIRSFGVPLSAGDVATISRFHDRFIAAGLSLQFNTLGRVPQWHYPTLRDLVLADDGAGRQANYLASESAFQFVKALEERDLVIPVVGDLGGATALDAIARFLRSENHPLSAFYVSNVEFYLHRDGGYLQFVDNLRRFARADHAVLIRSIFGQGGSVSQAAPIEVSVGIQSPPLGR
jgi:hypothetical protein